MMEAGRRADSEKALSRTTPQAYDDEPPRISGLTIFREERDDYQQDLANVRRVKHKPVIYQREMAGGYEGLGNQDLDPWIKYLMDQIEDLQERAYGRDGITHRMEERESPFTEEISSVPIPYHIKISRKDMCGYNGTENPDDHMDTYLDWMNMQGASDALKCKIFPLTLIGDA
ncbi:hypothetical protein ACOSP7_031656 [Xanthoceras sorbifolium]